MAEEEGAKERELAPWEQHSAVISIPRFDYNAPCSLLQRSHSGFLITCPIKREKSATKEAISLLAKYVQCFNASSSEDNTASKRRRLSETNAGESNSATTANSGDAPQGITFTLLRDDDAPEGAPSSSPLKVDAKGESSPLLSLVKLTKSGLLLLIFPGSTSFDVVDTVSKLIQSVESGSCGSVLWCNRIFPIQATCSLNEKELQEVVSKLVLQFMKDNKFLEQPIKFAVGYNRRGIETEFNNPKEASNATELLDRDECLTAVASAVIGVAPNSVVDLQSPELSVLIEILPLSGVPKGSLVVGVSVLPRSVVKPKPKLSIKALVSDNKTKGKKH